MRCAWVELERLDASLASLARGEAALRLRLGQALEVLGRGGVFSLGFSSLAAYALERCERSVRWAEGARCLARRVEVLPRLREALAAGRMSWSMAEVVARVATPADEVRWIEMAASRTVRQMRLLVAEGLTTGLAENLANGVATCVEAASPSVYARVTGGRGLAARMCSDADGEGSATEEMATLTCTVNREDAWLFEATRCLLEALGARTTDEQSEALLAEARATLQPLASAESSPASDGSQQIQQMQRRWVCELARWRDRAEAMCETRLLGTLLASRGEGHREAAQERDGSVVAAARGLASLEGAPDAAIDAQVRGLARALARRELELSVLLLMFHRADGWRRLGYATEAQYARERLGASPSLLLARRALALRLEKLPAIAAALGAGQIGVEAALQIVRVATPGTEAQWVTRARCRTIKHLREEVAAASTAVRWSGELDCPPPVNAEIEAFHRLEQAVVSGRACVPSAAVPQAPRVAEHGVAVSMAPRASGVASGERRAWFVMLASLASWLGRALLGGGPWGSELQTSAAGVEAARHAGRRASARSVMAAGRVTLRFRMSRENAVAWRELEARARRWLPPGMSWLRFMCSCLGDAWGHVLGAPVAYRHIYIRDRYRCLSPVCPRRDVTPHHLRFRSAGGSDAPENVGSLCTWCHLHGVHGGRIRARGPASHIHWELGPRGSPCVVVDGRERLAA
jgi:hypothetical protein